MVLFTIMYRVVLNFGSVGEILRTDRYKMKATEQHFPVVLFVILNKVVVLIFESADEILKCVHALLLRGCCTNVLSLKEIRTFDHSSKRYRTWADLEGVDCGPKFVLKYENKHIKIENK